MFTGIVEEVGTVRGIEGRGDVLGVRIAAARVRSSLAAGDSISISGCCVTVVGVDGDGFACELTRETLERTAFGERLRPGARVNLERALRADGRFDGHIVQGHVDGVARVLDVKTLGDSAEIAVQPPPDLERYLVLKGSVAVDGVSLTVTGVDAGCFSAALIPYTLRHTSLGSTARGDRVNIEVDVIAKYVERLLARRG